MGKIFNQGTTRAERVEDALRVLNGRQASVSFRKKDDRVRVEHGLLTVEWENSRLKVTKPQGSWRVININRVVSVEPNSARR